MSKLARCCTRSLRQPSHQTGQAYGSAAADPVTFLFAQKSNQKTRPVACRPHDAAVRVRKHWPDWVEGASVHLQPNPRDPSRIPQAAGPSSTCRQERAGESKAPRSAMRCAAVDPCPVLGWPGGFGKARRVARRDSGQFADSTGMCCQRTPEPSRAVVQLHRTTDPSGCAFFGLRFFAQTKKGDSRAGRREERFAILAVAIEKVRRGSRVLRLSRLAKTARLLGATQRSAPHPRALSRRDKGEKLRAAAQKRVARG